MDIGMLWFDNSNQSDLVSKVTRAVAYYQQKYGKKPNLCFVHPSMLNGKQPVEEKVSKVLAGDVEVRPSAKILPNHFWIGIEVNA